MKIDCSPILMEDMSEKEAVSLCEHLRTIGFFAQQIYGSHPLEDEFNSMVTQLSLIGSVGGDWIYISSENGNYISYELDTGEDTLMSNIYFEFKDDKLIVKRPEFDLRPLIVATHYVEDAIDKALQKYHKS